MPAAQPSRPGPEQQQQNRLQRQHRRQGDERHEKAADAHRANERNRNQKQQPEPDRDGSRREHHCPSRDGHRADDRLLPRAATPELLTKAVDDEQGVVDREPETDQPDEVRDICRRGQQVRQPVDGRQRAGDRAGREDERDRHHEGEAEDGHQHQERDREGNGLPAAQVSGEDRVEVVLDRRLAGDERDGVSRRPQRTPEIVGVTPGVLEVEPRRDIPVQDPAAGANLSSLSGWNDLGRLLEPAGRPPPSRGVGGVADMEHDDERSVGTLAEMFCK